ncbi:hypothetical protein ACJJAK_12430 [Staphylococcus equorum]|uniref:hypothetical protein n=1 Tax=Staphylococcus equorum TaxID=246432 RepID=UPI00403FD742
MNRLVCQMIPILLIPIISFIFIIQNFLFEIISVFGVDKKTLINIFSFLPFSERIVSLTAGIIITILLLIFFRRINKHKFFNTGNKYGKYPLFIYYLASKVFGFGRVNLVRIPIYLQFHLVIKEFFECVEVDQNAEVVDEKIKLQSINMNEISEELNLILEDTYEITREQIPVNKQKQPTIIISNGNEFTGVRTFNQKFVDEVRKQTNNYSKKFNYINIFATTNSKHNKIIIESSFKNAGRTGFKNLVVFQYNSTKEYFDENYTIL